MINTTMRYLAMILIVVFLGTALFGFIPVNDTAGMGLMDESCPIARLLNFACTSDFVSMVLEHISASQVFFSVTLASSFLLVLLVLVVVGHSFSSLGLLVITLNFNQLLRRNFFRYKNSFTLRKLFNWLSLFENSPSLA